MSEQIYVHYYPDRGYDESEFMSKLFWVPTLEEIKNDDTFSSPGQKPFGVWASPKDAEYGWIDWVKDNDYTTLVGYWNFKLDRDARILHVHHNEDVDNYIEPYISHAKTSNDIANIDLIEEMAIMRYHSFINTIYTWKPELYKDYDGMELHYSENKYELRYGRFYTWDCDSIVIWNPNIIIPLDHGKL